MGVLWASRTYANLDPLAHLGFELNRWSDVHALLNQFIDVCQIIGRYEIQQQFTPPLDWSMGNRSLDEITYGDRPPSKKYIESLPTSDRFSLDAITRKPVANDLSHRFASELLYNLGSLALAAADSSPQESKAAMSCVFRLLARMHNLGLISDEIYKYQPSNIHDQTFRPPGLHLLSNHIMTVLSDAAWLEHESKLAKTATEAGEYPPFLPFPVEFRELGPEIWFELILWCCVEHGSGKQGALLVKKMQSLQGEKEWKVESWAPLVQALDVVQETKIPSEQSWRRPDNHTPPNALTGRNKPPFNGLGTRTISREVVTCLRDTLYDNVYTGVGFHGLSLSELLSLEAPLTKILDPAGSNDDLRPTNMFTNWHITRIIESGCVEPNTDPDAFQRILRSTQSVVPPWQPGSTSEEDLEQVTRSQLYNESAAISGLVEYNIKGYIYQSQASRSFRQLALLQNIVDASKARHIQDFFEYMGRSESADIKLLEDGHSPNLKIPQSSLPGLSEGTMAGLMDMATSSRAYGFGNWLLFSNDADGPLIPESSYGNQILAPSLLRFATAVKNAQLCEKIIASLSLPLSVNTLKSLVNFHIAMGDWTRVRMTLNYLREFRLKSWGFQNLTSLAAKVVAIDADIKKKHARGELVEKKEEENLETATDILHRFFSGEFNTPTSKNRRVTDYQGRVLRRLHQVWSTFPEPLAGLMEQVEFKRASRSHQRLHYIPTVAFNQVFASVVENNGSKVGIEIFTRWCQDLLTPTSHRQQEGGVPRLLRRADIDPRRGYPSFDMDWHNEVQRKAVIPNLTTIRIIAQAALQEFELEQATTPQPAFDDDPQSASPNPSLFKTGYRLDVPKSIYRYVSRDGGKPPSSEAEAALDFCVTMYLRARAPEDQIDGDLPGHMDRLRARGVLSTRARARDLATAQAASKRVRDKAKELQNDPFLKAERVEATQA
ncbi:hypothetical protein N7523_006174 [Penicillium sp. IBT 18751x]|nr:hypothetical protein N7523_006174 [Penicillium sp. IBT 18751x]